MSASDRIIDTLNRAFDKHYIDNESLADIWIAFVKVPPNINEAATRIHFGQELAEKCRLPKYYLYSYEVVFEYAILEKYVVYKVSLQTLIKRGLQEHYFVVPCTTKGRPTVNVRSTADVRYYIIRELQRYTPWEIGTTLGVFAQTFGARAPLKWISYQLFRDCVRLSIADIDVVMLNCLDYYRHNCMSWAWCQALDPDSYNLADDEETFGVLWCRQKGCKNYYRYIRKAPFPIPSMNRACQKSCQ